MSTPMFERIRHKAIVALGMGLLLPLLCAWDSHASQQYWDVLVEDEAYAYRGDCSICHSGPAGVVNTATKPLAQTLKAGGVVGAMDKDVFRMKLIEILTGPDGTGTNETGSGTVDSDGDGADDLFELENQGNPSDPSVLPGGFVAPLEDVYGCLRVSRAPAGSDSLGVLSAGLLGLVLTSSLLRRRRRR